MTTPSPNAQTLWRETQYADVYESVTGFASKAELDLTVRSILENRLNPGDTTVDFGCGPAMISMALADQEIHAIGIDISTDMMQQGIEPPPHFFFLQSDMRSIKQILAMVKERTDNDLADAAFAINSWYVTTMPQDLDQPLPEDVAIQLRRQALLSMAAVLKPGGTLVIADPLDHGRDLNILEFLKEEFQAAKRIGRPPLAVLQNLLSRSTLEVARQNKVFRPLVHLFDSIEQMTNFITASGLFTIERTIGGPTPEDCLYGSIAVIVAKRTDVPIDSIDT